MLEEQPTATEEALLAIARAINTLATSVWE
jgi:hypothetical protein